MTKMRPPVSIENTLYRVLGEIGIDRAAAATGRSKDYLRGLSDPDKREILSVRDMVALDRACRAAGDPTYPLFETIRLMLAAADSVAPRCMANAKLCEYIAELVREQGEAIAALLSAVGDPDCQTKLRTALREAEEAHAAWADMIAVLANARDGPLYHPPDG